MALEINRKIGSPKDEAFTLFNMGVTHFNLGNYEKALNLFIRAKEKFSILRLMDLTQEADRNIEMVRDYLT